MWKPRVVKGSTKPANATIDDDDDGVPNRAIVASRLNRNMLSRTAQTVDDRSFRVCRDILVARNPIDTAFDKSTRRFESNLHVSMRSFLSTSIRSMSTRHKTLVTAEAKLFGRDAKKSEVLSLYRDVLRISQGFYWPNEQGEPWNITLKREARREIEANKDLTDPVEITRLLVQGQQAIHEVTRRLTDMEQSIKKRVDSTRTR